MLQSALNTIAGFLNTDGGTLLIGIADSGEIKSLERDLKLCKIHNSDGFEQKLRSLISSRFEPAPIGKIEVIFENFAEGMICRVDVQRSDEIVHLDGKEVYIRDGNVTRKLEGSMLTHWIKQR